LFGGCESQKQEKILVGISLPAKLSPRWQQDGTFLKQNLELLGYKVELLYAEESNKTQIRQIRNMLAKGIKILIVASIDANALGEVFKEAHQAKVPIIAYDRHIKNNPFIDYFYVSFDNSKIGHQMGEIIVRGLDLKNKKGPFNIEIFSGGAEDGNSYSYYVGAMNVLSPYIKKGVLKVVSNQISFTETEISNWDYSLAQKRMNNLLANNYTDKRLDAVLVPNDLIARAVKSSLKTKGYGTLEKPLPIIGGQDAEIAAVKSIIANEQYATIFKDIRKLANVTAKVADHIIKNGIESVKKDKTVLLPMINSLETVIIYKENIQFNLIDTGYFTLKEIS
jgi:putative multiple sugar transport system substrate-binding protein